MELKTAVLLVLAFLVLGILISVIAPIVLNLASFAPDTEDALMTELMSDCNNKINTYTISPNEGTRKSFCCAWRDLNNNGERDGEEWCARACTSCSSNGMSVQIICKNQVDYFSTPENCI